MASQVTVINTSFQRATIKVTPGKYLSDVVEEACKNWGLKASNYTVKNNNKPVDLSRTWRQSGLSPGAKLELVLASKSPSVVNVALQVADLKEVPGGRLVEKFQSTTTFWLILRKFESNGGLNLNFTQRGVAQTDNGSSGAGRIFYETPVLNVSGREISSFGDLQKTLAQLGFNSGSCMIRLNFRKTDTPLEVAIAEISQYFKEETVSIGEAAATPQVPALETTLLMPQQDLLSATNEMRTDAEGPIASEPTIEASVTTPEPPTDTVVLGPNRRPISVYAPPSGDTPKAALQPHNEADYEPTVAHAKLHQSRLQYSSQNRRLLSDIELERQEIEKAAKQATVKEVSVKFRFPDQSQIVSSFSPADTGKTLYSFARGVIAAKDQPFSLGLTSPKGPQTVPDNDKTTLINDLGFSGRVLVNFNWGEGVDDTARNGATLSPEFASKAQALLVPEVAAAPLEEDEPKPTVDEYSKGKEKESGGKIKGVPKWLKLGKK